MVIDSSFCVPAEHLHYGFGTKTVLQAASRTSDCQQLLHRFSSTGRQTVRGMLLMELLHTASSNTKPFTAVKNNSNNHSQKTRKSFFRLFVLYFSMENAPPSSSSVRCHLQISYMQTEQMRMI